MAVLHKSFGEGSHDAWRNSMKCITAIALCTIANETLINTPLHLQSVPSLSGKIVISRRNASCFSVSVLMEDAQMTRRC